MFGLIRRLFMWGMVAGLVWVILQLDYQGKPIKQWANEFFSAPLIKEVTRQAKGMAQDYLHKDVKEGAPSLDKMEPEDQAALEELLKEKIKE